jgi:trans-2,3-dihydro-3-hydroxyanthranilate isomerase
MRYLHLDVFTHVPLEGNQLAVFPDPPRDLSPSLMQRIAAEMNFSESTFVFPKEGDGDVRMRIFTPAEELPMAGHPTVGSTFALAAERVIAEGRRDFVFELGIGPTPVALEWQDGRLQFVWMTQRLPVFGPTMDGRLLAAPLGLDAADVVETLPVQPVSCGVPFLFAALASREAVDRVNIDRRALASSCQSAGIDELPVFLFTTDRRGATGDETVYSRMLAPGFGISEDPATGGACGPLGCYLFHHGVLDASQVQNFVNLQGVAMRRPSRISISIETEGGKITRVRVGGQAVIVGKGEINL